MHISRLKLNQNNILSCLLYIVIMVMGVLFILDRPFILEVSFYVVGGGIIAISLYMLIRLMLYSSGNKELLRSSFLRLTLIVMMMIGGVSIIIYANQGISFYQDVLASIFFFRSIYRYFYAYISRKTGHKTASIIFVVLATIGLALSAFFTFYHDSSKITGICAGIAVILEGLYGLYRIWFSRVHQRIKLTPDEPSTQPYYQSKSEIVITDYEIVEANTNKDKP